MNTKVLLTGTLLTAALVTTSAFADDTYDDFFDAAHYNLGGSSEATQDDKFIKINLKTIKPIVFITDLFGGSEQ